MTRRRGGSLGGKRGFDGVEPPQGGGLFAGSPGTSDYFAGGFGFAVEGE